jgi:hypothetical protein
VTATVQVLETVAEFVAQSAPRFEQTKMAELHATVNKFIQFGRALDVDGASIRAVAQMEYPKQDSLQEKVQLFYPLPRCSLFADLETWKRPAWKPVGFKGRNRIEISITERVHASQYDRPDIPDSGLICGRIQVKAEIEGHPEVGLVVLKEQQTQLSLPHFHQSVTNISDAPQGMQITFNPAVGPVSVFKYSLDAHDRLPVRGFYQMRELSSTHSKVLVQLKLADSGASLSFQTLHREFGSATNGGNRLY